MRAAAFAKINLALAVFNLFPGHPLDGDAPLERGLDRLQLAPGLRSLHAHLESLDLDSQLAARLMGFLQEKVDKGTLAEGREHAALREVVERTVRVAPDLAENGDGQQVVALVGPTGVGKTTTVAKLGRWLGERQKKSAMVVSCDVHRPAAIDQLRTLAGEVGLEFHASTPLQSPVAIAEGAFFEGRIHMSDKSSGPGGARLVRPILVRLVPAGPCPPRAAAASG